MSATTTATPLTVEAVLEAVKQLSPSELVRFDRDFLAWREQHGESLDHEGFLLLEIERNSHLPPPDQASFEELRRKRQAETLMPNEERELQALWERVEEMNVVRLDAMIELANCRNTTVRAVMNDLGIPDPPDVF